MISTWENTSPAIKAQTPEVALLPLARLGASHQELPIGAGILLVDAISRRVAEALPLRTFLLPVWGYGEHASGQMPAAGLSLGYETLASVVTDLVRSQYEHGIRRVVVLNSLGSAGAANALPAENFIVKTALRQLNYENAGLTAIWVQPFRQCRDEIKGIFTEAEITTGVIEASMILYLQPHQISRRTLEKLNTIPGANAEKGEKVLLVSVKAAIKYIEETFRLLDQIKGGK